MLARWTSVAVAAVTLLARSVAASEPPALRVVLHYEIQGSAQSCPSAEQLQASIVQQLGYDPFVSAPGAALHQVRVTLVRQGGSAEASIEWLDESGAVQGERRLSSPDDDCGELAAGVAFATVVQIQLRAAGAAAPSPPPPPPPAPPPAPKPRDEAPSPTRSYLVGAGGLVRFGRQPGVAAGLRTFATVAGRAWALQLDVHATVPTAAHGGGGSFSAREVGFGAAPCLKHRAVDACALGSFTLLSVRGEGVDEPRSPSAIGVGVGLRVQLTLPWHERVAPLVHADVLAQLAPREILLNREPVWSTAPIALAVGLDVAAIFR